MTLSLFIASFIIAGFLVVLLILSFEGMYSIFKNYHS